MMYQWITGYWGIIDEKSLDQLCKDLQCLLNKSEVNYRIDDDFEYVGGIKDPAGIVGGKLTVFAYGDDDVRHEVADTMYAYLAAKVTCEIDR